MFNIFPNGFHRGPYIFTFFKGFQGPTQLLGDYSVYIIVVLGLLGLYCGYIEQLVKVGRGSFHNPGGI